MLVPLTPSQLVGVGFPTATPDALWPRKEGQCAALASTAKEKIKRSSRKLFIHSSGSLQSMSGRFPTQALSDEQMIKVARRPGCAVNSCSFLFSLLKQGGLFALLQRDASDLVAFNTEGDGDAVEFDDSESRLVGRS